MLFQLGGSLELILCIHAEVYFLYPPYQNFSPLLAVVSGDGSEPSLCRVTDRATGGPNGEHPECCQLR